MKPFYLLLTLFITSFQLSLVNTFAQDKPPVKFGKISTEDFLLNGYKPDSSASAIVIADIGVSSFQGNDKGWFSLIFKRQKRIKILKQTGFGAADITIPLYFDGKAEEKLQNLKAITYNLENGNITETKLENNSVFKDKISKNKVVRKFTFPAVKEGSVIEYSYTVESDFVFNLQPWAFQGRYPVMWSEYEVRIPQFFGYVFLAQGYNQFHIKKNSTSFQSYRVQQENSTTGRSENFSVDASLAVNRWVMKDLPALKEESFTSTLENHISKIEFQLSEYRTPLTPRNILGNWITVNEELMKDEEFGAPLLTRNNWLDDDLKAITAGAATPLEKARLIYNYVRDNFTCTNHMARQLSNNLKTIFKSKNGNVADINLLMIAMMRHERIDADPVLLSTRENGLTHDMYPLISQYNYVIAELRFDDKVHYLDATHYLGFGKLSPDCYNGHARVIGLQSKPVYFMSDSLKERKVTSVFMINDEGGLNGQMRSDLGYYESLGVREKIKSKGEASYYSTLKSAFTSEIDMTKPGIDSLEKLEQPIQLHYDFKLKFDEDIIYFNPLMAEGYKDNMFKAADRKYPVEMPYAFDETYILNMEVPKNYMVEEVPKSAKVSLNENEGMFEYIVGVKADKIQLRTRVMLNKAYFLPEDYASLRDFFGYVVKKHSEQIVLKKKKV